MRALFHREPPSDATEELADNNPTQLEHTLEGDTLVRALIGGCIGNFLEWFDFALFGLFATEISATFFPPASANAQLVQAFSAFAGAFMARPFGGLFFGFLGDRYGRVYALRLSIMFMGVPTAALAVLPGYATLGWVSTLLLVLVRLLQGFSVGGQLSGAMTYAMELAPVGKKGFVGSLVHVTSSASVVGSLVVALCRWVFTPAQLLSWGWRVPFALSLLLIIAATVLRKHMPESQQLTEANEREGVRRDNPACTVLRLQYGTVLRVILVNLPYGCAYWILFNWLPSIVSNYRYLCEQSSTQADPNRRCIYLPLATGRAAEGCVEPADRTGLLNFVGMGDLGEPMDGADHTPCPWTAGLPLDGSAAYLTNTAAMFVWFFSLVGAGLVADHYGDPAVVLRRAIALGLCVCPPCFYLISSPSSGGERTTQVIVGSLILAGGLGMHVGPLTWWMASQLPDVQTRNSAIGICYNVAAMINGFGPVLATEVTHVFGMFWVCAVIGVWSFVGLVASSDWIWCVLGGTVVPPVRLGVVARPAIDDLPSTDGQTETSGATPLHAEDEGVRHKHGESGRASTSLVVAP